jgi:hypothetical protein
MKRDQPVQASRLIPRHTFADIAVTAPQKDKNGEAPDKIAQLIDLRLPGNLSNSIRLQPVCFNQEKYEVEPNVSFKDEKGILNTKQCPVANFIRWRYTPGTVAKKPVKESESATAERHKMERQIGLNFKQDVPKVSFVPFFC